MNIIKFRKFNESTEELHSDLKEELKSMIKEGPIDYKEFIDSFIKDPESTKIEGLINDSDVYEFYLKFRTDIDDILSEIKFFDEVPSEIGVFSLYEYIIKGTLRAIEDVVTSMK